MARSRWRFNDFEAYMATAYSLRDRLIESWNDTQEYFKYDDDDDALMIDDHVVPHVTTLPTQGGRPQACLLPVHGVFDGPLPPQRPLQHGRQGHLRGGTA